MWVIYIDLYKSGMSFCSSHGSESLLRYKIICGSVNSGCS